jgi:hypothetical protein
MREREKKSDFICCVEIIITVLYVFTIIICGKVDFYCIIITYFSANQAMGVVLGVVDFYFQPNFAPNLTQEEGKSKK